jgi:hypothetical protein
MTHVVAKPFNTVNRRFAVGAQVGEADDLAPHSFAELKENGFIAARAALAGAAAGERVSSGRSRALADKDGAS